MTKNLFSEYENL